MSRPLRVEFAGALYHVTARGNAREKIFLDDADRQTFLELLAREVRQQHWRLYAYCLMSNHYHLLVETPEANLARGMRRLNGVYTQAFNRRHGRVGHVLQGRYKSIVVDKDSYWLELCRYLVLNPVRARMVEKASAWRWSSYRATAGEIKAEDWLEVGPIVAQLGGHSAYRRFVTQGKGVPSPWAGLSGQIWLGSDAFLERMERLTSGLSHANVPRAHTRPSRPTADSIVHRVAESYGINRKQVLSREHREAFRAAVYLLRRMGNLSLQEVAALAQVSAPRISQIQRAIESGAAEPILAKLMTLYKVKN